MRNLITVVPTLWWMTQEIWHAGFKPYFMSEHWEYRWRAYAFTIAIMALTIVNVVASVYFSYKLNDLGTALQSGTTHDKYIWDTGSWIIAYLILFAVTDLLVLNILQLKHTVWWQQALMIWYTQQWSINDSDVGTAPQRIHECSKLISQTLCDLCLRGFRNIVGLIGFVPVVWMLSENFQFILPIPGLLVWFTILICVLETMVCLYLGRKLPYLDKITQEADGRYRAMLEKIQRRRMVGQPVESALRTLPKYIKIFRKRKFQYILCSIPLNLWQHMRNQYWGNGILLHAGYYVAVTLIIRQGVMAQAIAALAELRKSFSIFSDSWQSITQLQATVERIRELESASRKN